MSVKNMSVKNYDAVSCVLYDLRKQKISIDLIVDKIRSNQQIDDENASYCDFLSMASDMIGSCSSDLSKIIECIEKQVDFDYQ